MVITGTGAASGTAARMAAPASALPITSCPRVVVLGQGSGRRSTSLALDAGSLRAIMCGSGATSRSPVDSGRGSVLAVVVSDLVSLGLLVRRRLW